VIVEMSHGDDRETVKTPVEFCKLVTRARGASKEVTRRQQGAVARHDKDLAGQHVALLSQPHASAVDLLEILSRLTHPLRQVLELDWRVAGYFALETVADQIAALVSDSCRAWR
jgi:hypothetical protein